MIWVRFISVRSRRGFHTARYGKRAYPTHLKHTRMIFTAKHAENAEFSHFIPMRRYFHLTLRPQRSLR